jgi:carboxylate-amine ligase
MDFAPSAQPTVGIEFELQLLDANSLDLVDGIVPLIKFFPDNRNVKPEFIQSCVEISSPVCEDTTSAADQLLQTLHGVRQRSNELGIRLCGSGTHAFGTKLALITPNPRFLRMKSDYGIVGRNQLTFATHVHIGMPSGNMAIFVMRHLIPCLPVLLAMAANSPFWRGYHTGYASYRHCILAASQSYGLPPYFEDWDNFVRFSEMAKSAEVFATLKDIHWDIRPNPKLGTIELRVMDAASTVQTAGALAAFTRSLVVYLMEHASIELADWPVARLPRWIEQINRFQASHRGLEANYIVDEHGHVRPLQELAQELLTLIKPVAERIGEAPGVIALGSFLAAGAGYQRQQRDFEEAEDYSKVTESLADLLDREISGARQALAEGKREFNS